MGNDLLQTLLWFTACFMWWTPTLERLIIGLISASIALAFTARRREGEETLRIIEALIGSLSVGTAMIFSHRPGLVNFSLTGPGIMVIWNLAGIVSEVKDFFRDDVAPEEPDEETHEEEPKRGFLGGLFSKGG